MAKTKSKYPKGFYAHFPPRMFTRKPNKIIPAYTELSKVSVSDGDELIIEEGKRYRISLDHDYSGVYYPGECPSIEAYLIQFTEEDIENPNYASELRKYNRDKKKHSEELAEWEKWKAIWDKEEADAKVKAELKTLQKLKDKYEKQ
jgi:hypothetical protein